MSRFITYTGLGLLHSLNPLQSGGAETLQGHHRDVRLLETATKEPSTTSDGIPQGFGKIKRDSAGAIVGVEMPEEEDNSFVKEDDANLHIDMKVLSKWTIGEDVHNQDEDKEGLVKGKHSPSAS